MFIWPTLIGKYKSNVITTFEKKLGVGDDGHKIVFGLESHDGGSEISFSTRC
jgi:hypothetical protein